MTSFFLRGVLIQDDGTEDGYRRVDVTLAGGVIAALRPAGEGAAPAGASVLDCADKLLLPGSVNAHTHSSEHWAKGLIKPLPLELWIHQLVRAPAAWRA
jgi:5-methylthioadenosine/S-adenosylhomocysteine deaminase